MSRPEGYTPQGAQESSDSRESPLTTLQSTYSGTSGHSTSSTFKLPRKPVPSSPSSSALLQERTCSYERLTNEDEKTQPQEFKYWRQLRGLLLHGFLRFLVTAILIIALYEVIWSYSSYPLLTTDQKRVFNFLVTAFSLALGLNIASSLKSIAVKARWWILSWGKRPLDEVEDILGCHSLIKVIKLGYKSIYKKPSMTICCIIWLLINLASQAFIAVLGLNWSIEEGAIDLSYHVAGDVLSSNLTQFSSTNWNDTDSSEQIIAHLYGELQQVSYYVNFLPVDAPDRLPIIPPFTPYIQLKTYDLWDFPSYSQYVFMDFPVTDDVGSQFYTERSIISESSCHSSQWNATISPHGHTRVASVNASGITWSRMIPNTTTFMVNSTINDIASSCGNRCASLAILEMDSTSAYFYTCNVTVGTVSNTSNVPGREISDRIARMAAESIALTGFGDPDINFQSQVYDSGFSYGNPFYGDTSAMEQSLRLNAVSAIAGADKNNPWLDQLPGQVLGQGSKLILDHPIYIGAILGGIGGFHLIIFILAAYLANKVVVIPDNYLAISLLLQSVVGKLQERGISVNDKGIAIKDLEVAYGSVSKPTSTGSVRHLEISEASERPPNGWVGWYA